MQILPMNALGWLHRLLNILSWLNGRLTCLGQRDDQMPSVARGKGSSAGSSLPINDEHEEEYGVNQLAKPQLLLRLDILEDIGGMH